MDCPAGPRGFSASSFEWCSIKGTSRKARLSSTTSCSALLTLVLSVATKAQALTRLNSRLLGGQNTECLIQEGPDTENNSPIMSVADQDVIMIPRSLHLPSTVNPPKDLIRCLPPHLSMYILGKAALILVSPKGNEWSPVCSGVSQYVT